jgi:hypothetical protein
MEWHVCCVNASARWTALYTHVRVPHAISKNKYIYIPESLCTPFPCITSRLHKWWSTKNLYQAIHGLLFKWVLMHAQGLESWLIYSFLHIKLLAKVILIIHRTHMQDDSEMVIWIMLSYLSRVICMLLFKRKIQP